MKIHWISPYRTDKNIGKVVNEAVVACCQREDDWFGLTDYDTLFLLPDTKANIEAIVAERSYDVLGCLTNRIGSTEQQLGGYFSEDDSIRTHISLARNAWYDKEQHVQPAKGDLAAFMLLFSYEAWIKCGGFIEERLNFDALFSRRARKLGLRMGVMQGIYVWHSYRLESDNPRADYKHLLNEK